MNRKLAVQKDEALANRQGEAAYRKAARTNAQQDWDAMWEAQAEIERCEARLDRLGLV